MRGYAENEISGLRPAEGDGLAELVAKAAAVKLLRQPGSVAYGGDAGTAGTAGLAQVVERLDELVDMLRHGDAFVRKVGDFDPPRRQDAP